MDLQVGRIKLYTLTIQHSFLEGGGGALRAGVLGKKDVCQSSSVLSHVRKSLI